MERRSGRELFMKLENIKVRISELEDKQKDYYSKYNELLTEADKKQAEKDNLIREANQYIWDTLPESKELTDLRIAKRIIETDNAER